MTGSRNRLRCPLMHSSPRVRAQLRPRLERSLRHVEQRATHPLRRRLLGPHRRAEVNPHLQRHEPRPLPEKVAAVKREDRAPDVFQPDRHDRHPGLAGDQFVAAVQFLQRRRAGQAAFGKQAHHLARVERLHRRLDGRARLLWADRDRAQQPHAPAQDARLVNFVVDQVADRPRAGQLQHDHVDVGDMVRQQEHAAGGGERLQAHRRHPVKRPAQQPERQAQQPFRRQEDDEDRHRQGGHGIKQELVRGSQLELGRDDVLQHDRDQAEDVHEKIVRRQDASAPGSARPSPAGAR